MTRFPWRYVHWPNSAFLISTLILTITAVPYYIWKYGVDLFQVVLFVLMFIATGLSITLGYHRLFSHLSFQAKWPVKLFTLIFGAGAFEGSAYVWSSDHRRHHKHVDHEDDPYDISKGFFYAHIGWIMFKMKPQPPFDNVADLQKDRLVMWQHNNLYAIGILVSFGLPTLIGWLWGGATSALGALLIGGVARVVCVQHMTFFINSLCHTIGNRPYSSKCSARDSWLMALFTFGEGYHNFHHEFQHDYRNGVKPWQFDPTKWAIWGLSRFSLVRNLRRVPDEKIMLAEIAEKQRLLAMRLEKSGATLSETSHALLQRAQEALHQAAIRWEQLKKEYLKATEHSLDGSREKLAQLREDLQRAAEQLRNAIQEWHAAHRMALAAC